MKYLKLYSNDESYMADKRNLGKLNVWVASTKSEKHVYYSSDSSGIDNSLCFTAMENGASVQMGLMDNNASTPMSLNNDGGTSTGWEAKSFYYKKNNDVAWTEWTFVEDKTSKITLNKGEKLYVMSDSYNSCGYSNNKCYCFNISEGKISASGSIMSLLNFTPVLPNYAFLGLFMRCTSLVSAPELPATTLAVGCYYSMFFRCSSLTQAPALPATTLADSCYYSMFNGCRSLTQAPELPATTLANYCYYCMFDGCYSLTKAPALPATTLASDCYDQMFYDCSSLTQAPALPATTLADSCYSEMFSGCSSLTQAPELPATTLADSCYSYMFYGCSKLNYIKALFTTTPGSSYTDGWLSGVSSTGTFVKSKAATWDVTGISGIPTGWTITTA